MFSKQTIQSQWRTSGPVITSAIIIICVAVWLLEVLLGLIWPVGSSLLIGAGRFAPYSATQQPWTFITSMFLHSPRSILHIAFNMLALWSVGPMLERMMGHWPFLALYTLSGLGGGLGMMVWAAIHPTDASSWVTGAYGASGALFGLFAATLVVYRRIGEDIRSMLVWMVVNFMLPFVVGGIAWQAHVGGFIIGGILTILLVSGPRTFRYKSVGSRTLIYGIMMLVVIITGVALCNTANPFTMYLGAMV